MTILLPQYFEALKTAVITQTRLTSITPCDCKIISVLIFNKTKLRISETTLKRIYGFAYSKFKPSLFTIDVMAKYCGYDGWGDFCEKQEAATAKTQANSTSWETLKQQTDKITNFTLQALKNKSGIPYNLTIKRQFIYDHFDTFLNGAYTATAFCAPAGYGKTMAVCNWIENRLELSAKSENDDIILFFSSSALMNVFLSGRNLNDWILGLLGYTSDTDLASLLDVTQRKSGNFYLVLDGFDEHSYKPEQFQLLISQIIDIFSMYHGITWFKLVLTMRSSTWINYMHEFKNDHEKWFKGSMCHSHLAINVPLFTMQEIKRLCQNINPAIQNFLAIELSENFNHPLYFQFYYKNHKDNFSLNNIDHVCIYELISTFILNKVYLGHHSSDKLILMRALVSHMDFEKEIYDIPKLKVNALLKQYYNAYNELIGVGFIREINASSDLNYNTYIQFGNSNFLQYTITKALLEDNDYIFDDKLIDIINTKFNNKHKLFILKWSISYAFKTGQQNNFAYITHAKLSPNEKSDLVTFLGDLLEKSRLQSNNLESIVQYFKQDKNDKLFNYFFGVEFISADYKKTLLTLFKFELSDRKKILIQTGLATIAIMQLDIISLAEHLQSLKSFPHHSFGQFAINPVNCVEAIYQYFRFGIIKKDFFAELTRFYFNPEIYGGASRSLKTNEVIYILSGFSLTICRKPSKILRFIRALNKIYQPDAEVSKTYQFFMLVLESEAYSLANNSQKMTELACGIKQLYEEEKKGSFTKFMNSIYTASKIKRALINQDYCKIPGYLKYMVQISEESGNKLSRTFISFKILVDEHLMDLFPQFYKQVKYDNSKLLRDCGLNPEIFSNAAIYKLLK